MGWPNDIWPPGLYPDGWIGGGSGLGYTGEFI